MLHREEEVMIDFHCVKCMKMTKYPNRIFDNDRECPDVTVWCTPCWNTAHPNEQYSDDVRLGDGHRGKRST